MRSLARLEVSQGEDKAYVYSFDRPSTADPDGSGHGQEVGYVFGSLEVGGRALSDEMQGYWVNFAAHGDPHGPGHDVARLQRPARDAVRR